MGVTGQTCVKSAFLYVKEKQVGDPALVTLSGDSSVGLFSKFSKEAQLFLELTVQWGLLQSHLPSIQRLFMESKF